jgi:hypothetical protein
MGENVGVFKDYIGKLSTGHDYYEVTTKEGKVSYAIVGVDGECFNVAEQRRLVLEAKRDLDFSMWEYCMHFSKCNGLPVAQLTSNSDFFPKDAPLREGETFFDYVKRLYSGGKEAIDEIYLIDKINENLGKEAL